jgi:hypothetical protein
MIFFDVIVIQMKERTKMAVGHVGLWQWLKMNVNFFHSISCSGCELAYQYHNKTINNTST